MTIDRPLPSQIPQLRALWQEAFADPDSFLDLFFSRAFHRERCSVANLDGEVAAALYWFDCTCRGQKLAYVYAVATAKKHRGQGLARELMVATHTHLAACGYHGVVLVPAEESLFAYYERLGYTPFGGVEELCCEAAEAVPMEKLDGQTYAQLRRQYLPEGGVVQEGENLALLEGMTAFYAGDGFLLCAATEDGKVLGAELLGDKAAAPGIVAALGCESGSFRTPGSKPFAMFHGFAVLATPSYFGHALD